MLALHWQVNVIEPEGFFGCMLAEPVRSFAEDRCVIDNQKLSGLADDRLRGTADEAREAVGDR